MLHALDYTVNVIRLLNLLSAPVFHFFEGRPRVVIPALVIPGDIAQQIARPGELRHIVRQHAETLFFSRNAGLRPGPSTDFCNRCSLKRARTQLGCPTPANKVQDQRDGSENEQYVKKSTRYVKNTHAQYPRNQQHRKQNRKGGQNYDI